MKWTNVFTSKEDQKKIKINKKMNKEMYITGPCIFWSFDFLFNFVSRKMKNSSFFVFLFFAKNEKQEFGLIFSFSFRVRKMNKQLEYSISTRGRELNSPFCWLVRQKKRSNHAVISPSAVPRGRILVLCCSSSCTDS